MKDNVAYTLAYVRVKITNVEAVRDEYMQYIGGSHMLNVSIMMYLL